jgi:hypothetical protein
MFQGSVCSKNSSIVLQSTIDSQASPEPVPSFFHLRHVYSTLILPLRGHCQVGSCQSTSPQNSSLIPPYSKRIPSLHHYNFTHDELWSLSYCTALRKLRRPENLDTLGTNFTSKLRMDQQSHQTWNPLPIGIRYAPRRFLHQFLIAYYQIRRIWWSISEPHWCFAIF